MINLSLSASGFTRRAYWLKKRQARVVRAICLWPLLSILILTCCKKDGGRLVSPSFGQLSISITMTGNAPALLICVDGITTDTIREGTVKLFIKTGERKLSITDLRNTVILDTVMSIQVRNPVILTGLYTGYAVLLDDSDSSLKPEPDSLLIRFATTDQLLPDLLDIELSLYDFAGTHIPLSGKVVKGIRKDRFSSYIQLADPAVIHPDFSSFYYVIEAYDATPGREYKKVMSIEESTVSYLDYSGDFSYTWIPDNIISFGIGPAPADGSTGIRNPQLIFQRIAQ